MLLPLPGVHVVLNDENASNDNVQKIPFLRCQSLNVAGRCRVGMVRAIYRYDSKMRGENDSLTIVTHRTCFTANVITVIVIYVVYLVFICLLKEN